MNRRSRAWGIPLLVLLALFPVMAACSGVDFRVASKENANGIRYFRPATYVLIKPDYQNQAAKLEWKTLPDTSRAYSATPYAYMAKNITELEFADGILVKMDSQADSTSIPKAALAALNEVIKSAMETAAKAAAAGFTVSRDKRDSDKRVGPPTDTIFLFKVEDDGTGLVVKKLYPPNP